MDLPPQVMKQQVRDLAASQDLEALRSGAALETFGPRWPVLQAFQEFLEVERRKARRRLLMTAFSFLAILVLVIASGFAAFLYMNGKVKRDVRALEAALASARGETSALRGNTETMQKAIDEAQQALVAVRQQLEAGVARPTVDLAGMTASLGLLQEMHRLRAEQMDLAARQLALLNDVRQWDAERQAGAQRLELLQGERADLAKAMESFASRRQDLEKGLHEVRVAGGLATPRADDVLQRGPPRGKGKPSSATTAPAPVFDPTAALALLQEIYRLRTEQPDLAARQASLQEGLQKVIAAQQAGAARREQLSATRTELAQAVENYLSRQQDLQARLTALR